jgi:hypothetical protein
MDISPGGLACKKGKIAPRHEDIWASGGVPPSFLIAALHGVEWSASRSGHFTPGEKAPVTHWIGGWAGPRIGLDTVEKRRILHCR